MVVICATTWPGFERLHIWINKHCPDIPIPKSLVVLVRFLNPIYPFRSGNVSIFTPGAFSLMYMGARNVNTSHREELLSEVLVMSWLTGLKVMTLIIINNNSLGYLCNIPPTEAPIHSSPQRTKPFRHTQKLYDI
ncbi:hypothetical protein I7I48_03315 [Histoplasma ohiense]|nr:hypothetical protein I7I48_03315 [Histoplasma ohiense (nom. inval.)]